MVAAQDEVPGEEDEEGVIEINGVRYAPVVSEEDDEDEEAIGEEEEDLVVGFAVLCHDLAKPETTVKGEDGRYRSPNHEKLGEIPTRSFLARMTNQNNLIDEIVSLVKRHLAPRIFHKDQAGDSAIRSRKDLAAGDLINLIHLPVTNIFHGLGAKEHIS